MTVGQAVRASFRTVTILQFIPQTLLNLLVILSTLTTILHSRVNTKPVFVFILNLAVADFALAVVVMVVVNLRYQAGDEPRYTHRKCHAQVGVWLWVVWVSISSIGMLTLDRFLYITTTLQYSSIVTNIRVIIALFSCWLLPAGVSAAYIIFYKYIVTSFD